MKVISHQIIQSLPISAEEWLRWTDTVLRNKSQYIMPPKTSIHLEDGRYFNTMPAIMPPERVMGVKVVDRFLNRVPTLDSQITLYDEQTGEALAYMDGNYITAMRTGAAAVHAIDLLANPDFEVVGMMGFGNIGMAIVKLLLARYRDKHFTFKLLNYKDHAARVTERFAEYTNVRFCPVDSTRELICKSDIVISSIAYTEELLGEDDWFKEGCTVLPVHLRGFQNCDLFFDKVYTDDRAQVKGFRYYDRFKSLHEISEVLADPSLGRTDAKQRILVYNVGNALQDLYAASKICSLVTQAEMTVPYLGPTEKDWM